MNLSNDTVVKLWKRGIKICLLEQKRVILHTTNLLDTLIRMQHKWWKLWKMEADDVIKSDWTLQEWELLYYYK